ncbi:MAG: bifunctional heptose 7-phosphate kinase/heptose 1-phosphate adenyltransferase [Bacteroidota bacterium]|jgi:rfaE bifunctional protein kinase chain/domain
MKIPALAKSFKNKRILVLGDVMLDAYLMGHSTRMSPEAPVPVLLENETIYKPGGAANVAINLVHLGAKPILVSLTGKDAAGKTLRGLLRKQKIDTKYLLVSKSRKTTLKTRVMQGRQQMLRVDREDTNTLTKAESDMLCKQLLDLFDKAAPDAIIIEDYNKGVLSTEVIACVLKNAAKRKIPVAVDPKQKHFFDFRAVQLFKPNLRELTEGMGIALKTPPTLKQLDFLASQFFTKTGVKNLMVTLSEHGVYINNRKESAIFPAESIDIADVSGAGDTVISVVTLAMLAGFTPAQWAILANLAGAQVCEQAGVVPVNIEKLEKAWKKHIQTGLNQ